jgi:hypothetical protein
MSHIGGDWYEDVDAGSGAAYYTNYTTGEVTWEYPTDLPSASPEGAGEWVETLDEGSGTYYYLHSVTGESRWDNPNAAVTESGSGAGSGGGDSGLSPEDDPANWTSGVDESSGYTYYFNAVTQVNQWEPPACMSDAADSTSGNTEAPKEEEETSVITEENKATITPPPAPAKKATVVPPPAPAPAKKATITPPPAPAKKATVVPPKAPAPKKASLPVPPSVTAATKEPETEGDVSVSVPVPPPSQPTSKTASATPPPPAPVKTSTDAADTEKGEGQSKIAAESKTDSKSEVPAVTEGVKTLGLRGRPSKQASFSALRALDETMEDNGEEDDSDNDVEPRDFKKPDLFRDTSVVLNAPASTGIGHRQSTIQMLPSKDDATTHALCEQVFDVTFQQYGEKNYNFERKGLFKGRTTIEKMTTWKADLIKTSLRILSSELSSEAVQIFKNVTGYMKDRASSKSPIDHVIKILNQMMLAPEELRDELYCQLCKQTNGNPKPESTESGWQLFMIALATFPPSFDLMPHLMAYFVENLTHEIPNCAKYAEICLHRCPKICKLGARRELPTKLELETIRRGGVVTVRVFFLDGKYATLRADSWTTVRELEDSISTLLKIQNNEPFSLCEVSNTEEERVPDPDERILDIISFWDRTANEGFEKGSTDIEEFCFQYKIGLFYDIEDTDLAAIELLYIQATHDIVDSRYPCSEQDSITLAALQMQEEYGDYLGEGKCTYLRGNLGKYLAARLIQQSDGATLEEQIYTLYAKLVGYSQLEARLSYLDYVKSWKIYGSTYFFVEPQNSKDLPKECVLAVNNKGVTVISPTTKEFLAEYNYSTVVTWGHSPNSFVIVTGTQTRQIKVYFKTEQGKELNNMLKCYIEHRKA